MLMIKKGKQKTQFFGVYVCDKCGAEYLYLDMEKRKYVPDKITFNDDIYMAADLCPNCGHYLRHLILTHEKYAEELKDLKLTTADGDVIKMKEEGLFIYM